MQAPCCHFYFIVMKSYFSVLILLLIFSCSSTNTSEVPEQNLSDKTQSAYFQVMPEGVIQGQYQAKAVSATQLVSNYQSPANQRHPRLVEFKFSLNGKDNELPVGVNHSMVLQPENERVSSPVITFGEHYTDNKENPVDSFLEPNTQFTIQLDMKPVLRAFAKQGYFQDYKGNRIYQSDFRGVYVAGNAEPLSWDFENLAGMEGLELTDADKDSIYQTTITLNKYNAENFTAKEWKLTQDIADYPQYTSSWPLLEALYNLSLEEMKLDVRPDNTFMAGAKWNGVWTRDISYSILLSLAALEPEIAKNSLLAKTKDGIIIQDTGTGGSWPVSTDRMTWALAAWEVYVVTGDKNWLEQAYSFIKNSAEQDLKYAYDKRTGMFRGESSFLDWRKQSYPRWMGPKEIYLSQNLGTNAVHYQTYKILEMMAAALNEPESNWSAIAEGIKKGINGYLWQEDRGIYGQYLYGDHFLYASPRFEALGEALTVIYGIAEEARAEKVISSAPLLPYGIPTIYPQIPDVPPYHNKSMWPFVQAYWNWAAAKQQNEKVLEHGLNAIYRQATLFLTNKENLVIESGDFKGTEINSDRQLWSVAGNLAMVYRVFLGMNFTQEGIRLAPVVPQKYAGPHSISGFKYRNANLSISVEGWGSSIKLIELDGNQLDSPLIPANLSGEHNVRIVLASESVEEYTEAALANHHNSLPTVEAKLTDNTLSWKAIDSVSGYIVLKNGERWKEPQVQSIEVDSDDYAEYTVLAMDEQGWPSFSSEPLSLGPEPIIIQAETAGDVNQDAAGFTGAGYLVLTKTANTSLAYRVEIPETGLYLLKARYSNGSGPINTDNKCAIRTILINEVDYPLIMPQLGYQEWSNWGWSNPLAVELSKGQHTFKITYTEADKNMNAEVNQAYLDKIILIRLP